MRILIIGSDRKIFEEGSAVSERLIEYAGSDIELHIIVFSKKTLGYKEKKISDRVYAYPTNSSFKVNYPGDAVKIARKLYAEKGGFDVVSTQDPFESGLAGANISKIFNTPLHVQVHTDFLSPHFAKESMLNRLRVRIALKKVLPRASAVRTVSYKIKESLLSTSYILPSVPISVLPIFVDGNKFAESHADTDLHKKYPQFSFIILMVSRLTREKNIANALDVLSRIVKHHPKTGMVIVGDGPDGVKLKSYAKKLGIEKNVIFEGWQGDTSPHYKTADLFLLTSLYEGFGMALVEAAFGGCPIVSSDVGIADTVVRAGELGRVCAVGDTKCFSTSIIDIMNNSGFRNAVRFNGPLIASKLFPASKELYIEQYRKDWIKAIGK